MPPPAVVQEFVSQLRRIAARHNQRRALVISGDEAWTRQAAQAATDGFPPDAALWVTQHPLPATNTLPASRAHQVLGRELDAVVFDAFSGFDLDAFGAVSGAVRGGGLLILLTPPLAVWPSFADSEYTRITVAGYPSEAIRGRFLQRLVRVLTSDPDVHVVEQGKALPEKPPAAEQEGDILPHIEGPCRTEDQRRAVEALVKVVTGQRRRPAVLTSDRGRGKSAAFGIAAAQLLQQGLKHIVVTAPRLDAVEPIFHHAHRLLPKAEVSRGRLHWQDAFMAFVPPDELVLQPREADLVLVDEAAAIPTPLLERLLDHYPRIAFATTVHGYEGTGRGFAIRFHQVLDRRSRGWHALRLETPIRWSPGDPLERLVFRALLLDASPAPDEALAGAVPGRCTVERVDRDRLVADEATLSELFGLLVLAHYRTRPYDLRHLLDGPNLSVYIMRYAGHVVGTALVAQEGGFDAVTSQAIWEGRTRPHGHLIPESLAAHMGLEQAPRLRCGRIMRIAVHPAAQGRGLGTTLIAAVVDGARNDGLDTVGSSFGATEELLQFWGRSALTPVRVSVKRGATSGAHSVIVLRPLSDAGQALMDQARERFLTHFPHQLSDPLRDLEPGLAVRLLQQAGERIPLVLKAPDWQDLEAFVFRNRAYEVSIAPLWQLGCAALTDAAACERLEEKERDALLLKVLQKRAWQEAAGILDVPGRAQVIELIRQAVRALLAHYRQ